MEEAQWEIEYLDTCRGYGLRDAGRRSIIWIALCGGGERGGSSCDSRCKAIGLIWREVTER